MQTIYEFTQPLRRDWDAKKVELLSRVKLVRCVLL